MTINIFKNYGCLGAEKRIIYTYGYQHHTAVCSDAITVKIPEGWGTYESTMGNLVLVSPWGCTYLVSDVLDGNEIPCFIAWEDYGKKRRIELEVL